MLTLSSSENAVGKHVEAVRDLKDALAEIETVLAAQPDDTNVKFELANAQSRVGQMLIDARDFATAIPHVTRSLALLGELLHADPANAAFRRGQFIVEGALATALRGTGQVSAGVEHNESDAASSGSEPGLSKQPAVPHGRWYQRAQALRWVTRSRGCRSRAASGAAGYGDPMRQDPAAGNAYLALHNPKDAASILREDVRTASAQSQKDTRNAILIYDRNASARVYKSSG